MQRDTFNTVLKNHRDRIYAHALLCLRDADDAADITQETFLRLWRSGPDLEEPRLAAWLTRVAHNLCIDLTRRRRTQYTRLGRPDPEIVERLAAPASADHADSADGPDLLAALGTLPPETRSIMLMHYYEGLKLREIAAVLDKNVNSLKVRIHRARKSLRAVLEDAGVAPVAARRESC